MKELSILVTGGAGFIGSRLVRALLHADPHRRIWVLDNLHPQVHGSKAATPAFPSQVEFVRGDVADPDAVRAVVRQAAPRLVYHLAAETGTGQSFDEPARYCNVNVMGTAHLLEALRGVDSTRRVVLAGSRAVYGEGAYVDSDGCEHIGLPRLDSRMKARDFSVPLPMGARFPSTAGKSHGELPPAPTSVYASTKLMQEYLLTQAGQGADWGAIILRFQNVYGPGQSLRNPYTGVLSHFARQLLMGKDLSIFEDGEIARDFVFVDDVVDALLRAGDRALPHGAIVDIGSGSPTTILKAARILQRELNCNEAVLRITSEFRAGDIRHACAHIENARRLLEWYPSIGIEEGLSQLAMWARREYEASLLES